MTPSTAWRETIPEGEEALLAELAVKLAGLQKRRQRERPAPDRGLHAKGHLGLRATFTVDDGLPAHARQGLFARPGRHRAFVRLSNGSGARVHDKLGDIRGIAVKVIGVEGAKVLGEHGSQDFLAIHTPTVSLTSPEDFVALVLATAEKNPLPGLIKAFGLWRTLKLGLGAAKTLMKNPVDLTDVTFHTVLPIAFGPYAGRLQLVPRHAPSPRQRPGREPDYLGARLAARAAAAPLTWEVRAQFFTGAATPIEDPSVDWPSPWTRVGELRSEGGPSPALTALIEQMSFDPWHALVEHRPLGAMMRARKHAYFASTQARGAAGEPDAQVWEAAS